MSAIEKRTSSKEEAGDNNVNRRHSKGELKWRNRSWTVVFIAVFVSYLILAIWVIFQVHKNADIYLDIDDAKLPSFLKNFRVEKRQNSEAGGLAVEQPPPVDLNVARILAGASLLGLSCSLLLLAFTIFFPLALVWSGHVLMIASTLLGGGCKSRYHLDLASAHHPAALMRGQVQGAAIAFTVAILLILSCCLKSLRDMMRRAAVMIRAISGIGWANPSVYVLSVAGCDAAGGCGWAKAIFAIIYILFAQNWIGGTIANIITATLAGGPYSAWFQDPKWNPLDRFKPTVTAALWASLTISLGSLAFNAMITDLINLAVWILENIIGATTLAEKFNRYVCIVIGVNDFQLSYSEAAKRTYAFAKKGAIVPQKHLEKLQSIGNWSENFGGRQAKKMGPIAARLNDDKQNRLSTNHFKNGLGALINDALVANALGFGSLACGVVAVIATYLYMQNGGNGVTRAFVVYAFFMAFAIASILSKAIEAGVSTLYVCIYGPPGEVNSYGQSQMPVRDILMENCSELYDLMMERYPKVFDGAYREGEKKVPLDERAPLKPGDS
ncbi:uncharacterized protein MKK02DRAFT_29195 [Dioszegia hungarica]|uniref:Protein PNS1 n=1 Tax=Dioszegia hungarica TaxID=4972 RepID=A0AA38LU29_9TREE|nr:uncharacterized protein MKK02DRAFT_29195 [Dioszegia hungarica]KAI9633346.1 hypothetical protein MKK02DRAFT_29195 [Dioszegia hungarica]